jgi:hypothetical protein
MKKYKSIFYSAMFLVVTFAMSSFDNPIPVPDPEVFGKKVIEVIKTGDTTLYKNTFMVEKEMLISFCEEALKDPYSSAGRKENFREQYRSNIEKALPKLSKTLTKNIQTIERWKEIEKISLNKIAYLRTYFKLVYDQRTGTFIVNNADVIVQHDSTFYALEFEEILLIKNKWYGGKLENISKSATPDFLEEYSYESTTEEGVAVDTVAMEPIEILKSDEKKLKKLNRLNKKIDKIYQSY